MLTSLKHSRKDGLWSPWVTESRGRFYYIAGFFHFIGGGDKLGKAESHSKIVKKSTGESGKDIVQQKQARTFYN